MQENIFQLLVFSFSLGQQVATYAHKLCHGLYFKKQSSIFIEKI